MSICSDEIGYVRTNEDLFGRNSILIRRLAYLFGRKLFVKVNKVSVRTNNLIFLQQRNCQRERKSQEKRERGRHSDMKCLIDIANTFFRALSDEII